MSTSKRPWAQWALAAVLALPLLALASWALLYHADLWSFRHQLEPTEGGLMLSTQAILKGLDPWKTELAPVYSNNYGLGFPWVAAQFSRLQPTLDLLQVLRQVSALCIFMVVGLLFLTLRDHQSSVLEAGAAALAIYIPLLHFDIPSGRPDTLALLLYVASLLALLRGGKGPLALAAILGVLSFFVKPYGVLALGLGGLLLLLRRRWQDLGFFIAITVLAGLGAGWWVLRSHPNYLLGTFFIHARASTFSLDWLLAQLGDLGRFHFPLLLLVLGSALNLRRQGAAWRPTGPAQDWIFLAFAAFAVLILGPGGHTGAYLRYFNELFVPLALVALVLWGRQLQVAPWALVLALTVNAGLCWDYQRRVCYPVSSEDEAGWYKAETWMVAHPKGFYPPLMTAMAYKHHAYIVDTDHSRYLIWAQAFGQPSDISAFSEERQSFYHNELVQKKIQTVVCGALWPCPSGLEQLGYQQVEPICLRTPLAAGRICFSVYTPTTKRKS